MDDVAVLGPGGVGGLLAALLARASATVTCLPGPRHPRHRAGGVDAYPHRASSTTAAPSVRRLASDLERAGVPVQVSDDAATVLWSKLAFLAALALLTTTAQETAGEVREHRRDDLVAMVAELTAVARAEGAALEAKVVAFFDGVPAGMRSSMQRDAEAGNRLELDAIGGAVVRAAGRHGIAVPVTSRYVDDLRARYRS